MRLFLKNLLFTVLVPGTVAGWIPWILTMDASAASGLWGLLSGILFALGGTIYSWCVWDFATAGGGTPAPIDAPKKLVVRGLYRYVRNPMYVGVLCLLFGWVSLFHVIPLAAYTLLVGSAFQSFVFFYEEPKLRSLFGDDYVRYCKRVGRWLPKMRRGS